jgi:hypothetical protein
MQKHRQPISQSLSGLCLENGPALLVSSTQNRICRYHEAGKIDLSWGIDWMSHQRSQEEIWNPMPQKGRW